MVEVITPPCVAQPPTGRAMHTVSRYQWRTDYITSHGPVTVGEIDDVGTPLASFCHLAGQNLGDGRPDSEPDGQCRVADRLDQRHVFAGQPRGVDKPTREQ